MENENQKKIVHTYADDLAKAMDTTDAKVVQELLEQGREKELLAKEEVTKKKQKVWYKLGAIVFVVGAILSLAYSIYHYKSLTVPPEKPVSVGVFPSTKAFVSNETDIRKVIESITSDSSFEKDRPYLVPIVKNADEPTLLGVKESFDFFESKASEPFIASFNIVRLGIINIGERNVPFVIASTKDAESSTKEFLIAENSLLQNIYKALGIDISVYDPEIGKSFVGEFLYNIPVRSLKYKNKEGIDQTIFFYARATQDIVVMTTSPQALKAIYNNLIGQIN